MLFQNRNAGTYALVTDIHGRPGHKTPDHVGATQVGYTADLRILKWPISGIPEIGAAKRAAQLPCKLRPQQPGNAREPPFHAPISTIRGGKTARRRALPQRGRRGHDCAAPLFSSSSSLRTSPPGTGFPVPFATPT